jgi:hypothetical protein
MGPGEPDADEDRANPADGYNNADCTRPIPSGHGSSVSHGGGDTGAWHCWSRGHTSPALLCETSVLLRRWTSRSWTRCLRRGAWTRCVTAPGLLPRYGAWGRGRSLRWPRSGRRRRGDRDASALVAELSLVGQEATAFSALHHTHTTNAGVECQWFEFEIHQPVPTSCIRCSCCTGTCPSPKCYENAIRWRAAFREPTL